MKHLIALLSLAFACAVHAATPSASSSLYNVEVLVFENRMPALEGGELWAQDKVRPLPEDMGDAQLPGLPEDSESILARAAEQLGQDGSYRMLLHGYWQQTAEAKSDTKPIRLATSDGTLDGLFRFYLSRFLHVDVNLQLRQPGDTADSPPLVMRLREHRRIRTQDIHYFDHPRFGMLVRIRPAEKT
jgi:hypothetical protein